MVGVCHQPNAAQLYPWCHRMVSLARQCAGVRTEHHDDQSVGPRHRPGHQRGHPAIPAVRHRRGHQPHAGIRRADGGSGGRIRTGRGRDGGAVPVQRQPDRDAGGDGPGSGSLPTAAGAPAARRQSPDVRRAR